MKTKVKEVLDRLAAESRLSASVLLEEGSDPGSPLHEYFAWDDEKAAHGFRLNQARDLIRSYKVFVRVSGNGAANVRAMVNVSHAPGRPEGTYEPRAGVMSDPEKRSRLLDGVLCQLERTLLLNADLVELDPVVDAVSKVRKRLSPAAAAE